MNVVRKIALVCSSIVVLPVFSYADTMAANALVDLQHEDGTIDLLSTNFHSTPDLGFTIFPIATAYSIMLKNDHQ